MKLLTHRIDYMRAVLALLLILSFQGALAALFKWQVPAENRDMVIYMLGQLSGMALTSMGFYFSTSKGSVDKTAVLAAQKDPRPDPDGPAEREL